MNFNDNITLNKYAEDANVNFDKMQDNLSEIDSKFQTRMNGKTTTRLTLSFIGTICWLIALVVASILIGFNAHFILLIVVLVASLGLMAFMIIDNIMSFSYYSKLTAYKDSINKLQNRVRIGKDSISSNHNTFMNSKANGWQIVLNASSSIPEEAASIENTVSTMENLKKGFVNSAKNVFYFATVIIMTIASCVVLFPISSNIICTITASSFSEGTLTIFNIIGLVIVGIGEIILAKWAWGKSGCAVTNVNLLVVLLAPVAFLALVALVTLIVLLVIKIIEILIGLAVVIIIVAIAIGCICGG